MSEGVLLAHLGISIRNIEVMVSTEDIVEAFDDLGYTLEDPKVIDRLCSLCDEYGVDENKVSCEYLAFANKKKYQAPTSDILDLFDLEVLKGLQSSNKENSKRVVLDSTNIQSWVDDEDDVSSSSKSSQSNKPILLGGGEIGSTNEVPDSSKIPVAPESPKDQPPKKSRLDPELLWNVSKRMELLVSRLHWPHP